MVMMDADDVAVTSIRGILRRASTGMTLLVRLTAMMAMIIMMITTRTSLLPPQEASCAGRHQVRRCWWGWWLWESCPALGGWSKTGPLLSRYLTPAHTDKRIYIYTHTYTHTHTQICTWGRNKDTHTDKHTLIHHSLIHLSFSQYFYIYNFVCIHMYVYLYTAIYTHTHVQIMTFTHTHTHTHTYRYWQIHTLAHTHTPDITDGFEVDKRFIHKVIHVN